jgi:5-methylcytosine-specific restriction endonuclease McrA
VGYRAMFRRQRGLCWLCDKPMDPKHVSPDHLTPVSKGGRNLPYNKKLAHPLCNNLRGNVPEAEAREYVQARLAERAARDAEIIRSLTQPKK